ncbi:hypothetical protein CcCBS67573_g06197 [Chytriomyces confervae]|uniref:Dolichol-phosphate mannosyltransferase subunit 3 n=1 Tax=Chytriomyces confervae TaxID=246404 RepID=A0A507F6V5_9FUNG|nr:hypothetical protein HDU80_004144 [Chytriomyces hyalinus]TPX71347.1 hypothetical protein CcCBS67573_g06197 [Chytriomyces confervae]
MGRAQTLALVAGAGTIAWVLLMLHATFLPFLGLPKYVDEVAPVLPLWGLVAFGSYSLASIGYALVTFGDCPEAHLSLMKEITEAKIDLKRRGIQVN